MDNKPKKIVFNVEFLKKFEKINNSGFIKGRARIAYAGKNRNGSNIPKEAFERAMDSLALIPVVGHWIEEINNFGGHDVAFEEVGNEIKIVDKTKPYGVVPENHNARWVDVEDENGNIKRYLECDVILWQERYKEPIQKIIDGGVNQSMEIVPTNCEWDEESGYYNINDFYYSALCLLGRDKEDKSKNVEPCFEDAEVTVYQFNLDKEEFKKEFALMVKELKQSINSSNQSQLQNQNQQNKGGENVEISKFATYNQKREALRNALNSEITRDDDGNIIEEIYYWVVDFDDEYVYVERNHWKEGDFNTEYGRFTYSFDEEKLEATITSEFEKMILVWLTEEEHQKIQEERKKYETIFKEYEELKQNYNKLEIETNELREYKTKVEKEKLEEQQAELFAQYDALLKDNAEYATIKENKDNYSIEELEKELALLYVKSNTKFAKKDRKKTIKLGIQPKDSANNILSPYGDLTLKFKNKN